LDLVPQKFVFTHHVRHFPVTVSMARTVRFPAVAPAAGVGIDYTEVVIGRTFVLSADPDIGFVINFPFNDPEQGMGNEIGHGITVGEPNLIGV
jgi:hypothetical protein